MGGPQLYLTSYDNQETLIRRLLAENGDFLSDYAIKDLREYLQIEQQSANPGELLYETLNIVAATADALRFYRKVAGSVDFAKELLAINRIMESYQLPLSQYPTATLAQQDIALLLSKISDLATPEKALLKQLQQPVGEAVAYDYHSLHPLEKRLLARYPQLSEPAEKFTVRFVKTLNVADEALWVVQDIIEKDLPLHQVRISGSASALQYVRNSLRQYGLSAPEPGGQRSLAFLRLLNQASTGELSLDEVCALAGCLPLDRQDLTVFNRYIRRLALPYRALADPFTYLNNEPAQQSAEAVRKVIFALLQQAQAHRHDDFATYARWLYEAALSDELSAGEQELLLKVRGAFQSLRGNRHNFCQTMIGELLAEITDQAATPLALTAKTSTLCRPYHYSLDNRLDSYLPAYLYRGILNEETAEILGLPAITDRRQQAEKQAGRAYRAGEQLTVTFETLAFNGEEITNDRQLLQRYGISDSQVENVTPRLAYQRFDTVDYKLKIKAETARALYLQQGSLKSSVTGLETYAGCHYRYFLDQGLQLPRQEQPSGSPADLGILLHEVMARAVKKYGPAYYDISKEEIGSLLDSCDKNMAYYHFRPAYRQVIRDFLGHQLLNSLAAYKLIETGSVCDPSHQEQRLSAALALPDGLRLQLTAFIDRIDVGGGAMVIKDYKSGGYGFSAASFIAGLALQLVTYTLLAEEKYHYRPLAAYYLPLQNPLINTGFYKLSKRIGLLSLQPNVGFIDKYEYSGLVYTAESADIALFNPTRRGIKGLKGNRTDNYDYEQLKTAWKAITARLAESILSGDIAAAPKAGACKYCRFALICRFRGESHNVPVYRAKNGEKISGEQLIAAYNRGEISDEI